MGIGMSQKEISSPPDAGPRLSGVALLRAVTMLFLCASALSSRAGQAKSGPALTQAGTSNDGYIGSEACSNCHSEIYRRFLQTSMGRSMTPVTPTFLQTSGYPCLVRG